MKRPAINYSMFDRYACKALLAHPVIKSDRVRRYVKEYMITDGMMPEEVRRKGITNSSVYNIDINKAITHLKKMGLLNRQTGGYYSVKDEYKTALNDKLNDTQFWINLRACANSKHEEEDLFNPVQDLI